jgi:hypothetical protein
MFPNHLHESLIETNNTEEMKHKIDSENLIINYHICGEEHPC